jgi:ubiquinone/menaquinone biosynthesis C-methylase UbiE
VPPPSLTALAAAVLRIQQVPERVLEIGCGKGDGTLFLAREFPAARVRGVDSSAEAVRHATARVGLDPEGRVAFKQAPRFRLPYPEDHFDLVCRSRGALRPSEVARVLRPDSHLILIGRAGPMLSWRLLGHGLEPVDAGSVEGVDFQISRLG